METHQANHKLSLVYYILSPALIAASQTFTKILDCLKVFFKRFRKKLYLRYLTEF